MHNRHITGMTKLLVANGHNGSFLSNVEIIDLSSQKTYCQDFPEFPMKIVEQSGGFYDFKTPILCGGWTGKVIIQIYFGRLRRGNC